MKVYFKEDNTPLDVFAVDAKELVATGLYSYEPVELPAKPVEPVASSTRRPA